jgi:uncharacterized protein YjbI with pentapeptide repeats
MPESLNHSEIIRRLKTGEGELIDLAGMDLSSIDLSGLTIKNVIFSNFHANKITNLTNANFKGCTIENARFSGAILSATNFRNCKFKWCDFRYIRCSQSTFQDSQFYGCDFYRANFEDYSIFEGAEMVGVSLFMANLQGAGIRKKNLGPEILQEDLKLFKEFHYHYMNVSEIDIEDFLAKRHYEAMQIYRHLTGIWASQGFFQDAGWAYVKSKRNEKTTYSPRYSHRVYKTKSVAAASPEKGFSNLLVALKYFPKFIVYWFIDLICGFGESLGRLITSIIALLLGSALIYWVTGGLKSPAGTVYTGFLDCLIFSIGNLTATDFGRFIPTSRIAEIIIALQGLLGISLVGLFGFILGNKIRNS